MHARIIWEEQNDSRGTMPRLFLCTLQLESRLDKALDEAKVKGRTVVNMKNDWKVIYPFENR